ncbi:MAG TPA: ATP synthase F1 subunit gamma [Lachnospiraceae bacterium]|nr:ATP synthase F1 subunit gamma [Lachnospiraceae bacterium]
MPNTKELQNRISSIRDTMKITNAMYMISSMKLRKTRTKLENTEPYFEGLKSEISNILLHLPDMEDRYFDTSEEDMDDDRERRRGFIIVVGDKGMAGAYNHNVIKEALGHISPEDRLFVVGEVGRHELRAEGYSVEPGFLFSANNPSMHRARVIAESVLELYKNKELDEVHFIYTHMLNSMNSEVRYERLLPLKTHTFLKEELIEKAMHEQGDKTREQIEREAEDWYMIYPSPKKVLENLVYNYITGYVYSVLVEGAASEENARMMAMQAATDNAREMLGELSVRYNRARQSAITQEITEVIAGAKALKKRKKQS